MPKEFLVALQPHCQKMSTADADRIFHSHGHTCQEIFTVRYGRYVAVAERMFNAGKQC